MRFQFYNIVCVVKAENRHKIQYCKADVCFINDHEEKMCVNMD